MPVELCASRFVVRKQTDNLKFPEEKKSNDFGNIISGNLHYS